MITTTLETARRMKEAGFEERTELVYCEGNSYTDYEVICNTFGLITRGKLEDVLEAGKYINPKRQLKYFSAHSTDELLAILPFTVNGDKLRIIRGETRVFHVWYGDPKAAFMNISLCESLAEMAIYLRKEQLL